MEPQPVTLMRFPSLDEAESALDWIGVDFADADGGFEGVLGPDDLERLDAAVADPESPEPVRDLARRLRDRLAEHDAGGAVWRVAFEA